MKKGMSFEEAMANLEKNVASLEQGNLPLEDSLKLYAESVELVAFCNKQLDETELKIEKLSAKVQTVLDGEENE